MAWFKRKHWKIFQNILVAGPFQGLKTGEWADSGSMNFENVYKMGFSCLRIPQLDYR
jgi:hypothetical protein